MKTRAIVRRGLVGRVVLLAAAACLPACGGAETSETSPDGECNATSIDGIAVTSTDAYGGTPYSLGYAPYAISGCSLAYVAEPAGGETAGALMLRDLSTGEEKVVSPASDKPRRPTLAGDVLAWEADDHGVRVIRVLMGDEPLTLNGPFDHLGEPRATADAVVFTAFLLADDLGDTDVYMLNVDAKKVVPIATGPGQQRFADVSPTHVAYADFSEDPDGRFDQNETDLADVVVFDRGTESSAARPRAGKQAFPLLEAEGKIAYLEWGPDHPEPKFSAYLLLVGDIESPAEEDVIAAEIETSSPYIRPAARKDTLTWVQWPTGDTATLMERPADLSSAAKPVEDMDGKALYAPSAAEHLTVAVTKDDVGQTVLRAVGH